MCSSSTQLSTSEGPGSVSGAPNLPAGFTDTFASRYIDTSELRQHAIIGGEGPPPLPVHGWPENWCAWRLLMPALARDFEVIAVHQRGMGLTETFQDGYDAGNLARDLVALMDALGHERFAVVGHDTGYIIGYAPAANHPHRVNRVALAEIPGPPLVASLPPLFVPEPINNRVWHMPFNRVDEELTEVLVRGREDIFFDFEFALQGGGRTLPGRRQMVVIPGVGHWVADQAPEEMLAALSVFLAPYREDRDVERETRAQSLIRCGRRSRCRTRSS